MPVMETTDVLDEPLAYDQQGAFLRQRSFGRANLLQEGEAAELKNCTADTSGVCRNRRGFRHDVDVGGSGTVQGAGFFNGSVDYKFVIRGGTVYFYDSSNSETSVALTGASTTAQAYWCQVGDDLYISTGNASEKLKRIDAATLTEAVDTTVSPPTDQKFLTAQGYRVFGVVEDKLVATDILPDADFYGTSTVAAAHIRIGEDRADATGLFAWQDNNLIFFKEDRMWMVNLAAVTPVTSPAANGLTNAVIRKISDRIGTVSHKSVAQVGNDAFFLARDGVRTVARVIHDGMASTTEPISLPIQDLIERINWEYAGTSTACYRERKYVLAVPLDIATTPNTVLVYDTSTNGWSYWTGIEPAEWIYTNFTEPVLSYADSSGFIAELRDYIDIANIDRADYIDFLDDVGVDDSASGWTDNDGYVQFNPDISLVVGDIVLITELLDNGGSPVSGAAGSVANVIEVDGDDVTIGFYHSSTGGGSSSISFIRGSKPDWSITSKGLVFGYALNPKTLDWVELEFTRDSDAYCDLSLILDDSDATEVQSNFASGGGEKVTLPLTLPFVLPKGKLTRKRFGLYGDHELAREIQFKLTESDTASEGELVSSRVVAIRSLTAAAFIEEFENVE